MQGKPPIGENYSNSSSCHKMGNNAGSAWTLKEHQYAGVHMQYLKVFSVMLSSAIATAFILKMVFEDQLLRDNGQLNIDDRLKLFRGFVAYKYSREHTRVLADLLELSSEDRRDFDPYYVNKIMNTDMIPLLPKDLTLEDLNKNLMKISYLCSLKPKEKSSEQKPRINLLERNSNYNLLRTISPKGSKEVLPGQMKFHWSPDQPHIEKHKNIIDISNFSVENNSFLLNLGLITHRLRQTFKFETEDTQPKLIGRCSKFMTIEEYAKIYCQEHFELCKNHIKPDFRGINRFESMGTYLVYKLFISEMHIYNSVIRDWIILFKDKYITRMGDSGDAFFFGFFMTSLVHRSVW